MQHLCRTLDPKSLQHTWHYSGSAKRAWMTSAGPLSAAWMKPDSDQLQQGHLWEGSSGRGGFLECLKLQTAQTNTADNDLREGSSLGVFKSCPKISTCCVTLLIWANTAPCLKIIATHTEAEEGSCYLVCPKPPKSRGASICRLTDGAADVNSMGLENCWWFLC